MCHTLLWNDLKHTLQIIKDIGEQVGVPIQDSGISVVHRLIPNNKEETIVNHNLSGATNIQNKKTPSIITMFTRWDVQIKLIEARKTLNTKPNCPVKLKAAAIYEDVTPWDLGLCLTYDNEGTSRCLSLYGQEEVVFIAEHPKKRAKGNI